MSSASSADTSKTSSTHPEIQLIGSEQKKRRGERCIALFGCSWQEPPCLLVQWSILESKDTLCACYHSVRRRRTYAIPCRNCSLVVRDGADKCQLHLRCVARAETAEMCGNTANGTACPTPSALNAHPMRVRPK